MSAIVIGVGPGLGLSLARAYGRTGRDVALIARRPGQLQGFVEKLAEEGITAYACPAEASDPESVRHAINAAEDAAGAPDIVHYNASFLPEGTPTHVSLRDVELAWRVGCFGAWAALQATVPLMLSSGGGTFFVTGGGLALEPWPPASALAGAKAAVRSLSLAAAKELRQTSVRVATVTVNGLIQPGTDLDPDRIADLFVDLLGRPELPVETVIP